MPYKKVAVVSFVVILILLASSTSAHASFLDNIKNSVGKVLSSLSPQSSSLNKDVHLSTNISLAPSGDINNDGIIDGGDIVRFTYEIKNLSETDYQYGKLKTNINLKNLYYINNIQGGYSMEDRNNTINFVNIYSHAHQVITISFDAYVINNLTSDPLITTQAQLISKQNNKIAEGILKELQAKRVSGDKIQQMEHSSKK